MTQLEGAAETERPRTPLALILGLLAVAAGVVAIFATSRGTDTPVPAGPVPPPVAPDSEPAMDSSPVQPAAAGDTPGSVVREPDSTRRADSLPDSSGTPAETLPSARPPIGDPAALPRPPVTLPRPEPDTGGARP